MKSELLIGCGSSRAKRLKCDGKDTWENLTTLDINADHKPQMVWDLNEFPYPLLDNSMDEIHAYEVLEHTGTQGDYKFFFKQFSEFHRILKPGGHFLATVPALNSVWAWGDPSHTRVIQKEQLIFLRQRSYEQVGTTSMSDFRNIYKADFDIVVAYEDAGCLNFILRAIK